MRFSKGKRAKSKNSTDKPHKIGVFTEKTGGQDKSDIVHVIADGYRYAPYIPCSRHHGDGGYFYLTGDAKEALANISDLGPISDSKALRNIAAFCEDAEISMAAVGKLTDESMLVFVASESKHLDSALEAVKKLDGKDSLLFDIARRDARSEVVDAAISMLVGNRRLLKRLALDCSGYGGRAALRTFRGDHETLKYIHVKTYLCVRPSGPPVAQPGEEPRRKQVRELLMETGGLEEYKFVIKGSAYKTVDVSCRKALEKLESMVPDLDDAEALRLVIKHTEDQGTKEAAFQKLCQIRGPLRRWMRDKWDALKISIYGDSPAPKYRRY